MTSLKQIEANRRNALKSTGPRSEEGKRRSRRNAIRHGLTAETVITDLENPADYKAFEAAIAADHDAQTAVERELVLRLASLLWRLRRATSIERGLFEIQSRQAEHRGSNGLTDHRCSALQVPAAGLDECRSDCRGHEVLAIPVQEESDDRHEIARSFMRLNNFYNGTFERLSRYETALWRQVGQTLFVLGALAPRNGYGRAWKKGPVNTGRLFKC